uniref:Alpha-type protein kinase domain-containing protein n=1 Tax=Macrostomum lignano TaxID=282301 RepID=A0A1I8F7P8_9PLAT
KDVGTALRVIFIQVRQREIIEGRKGGGAHVGGGMNLATPTPPGLASRLARCANYPNQLDQRWRGGVSSGGCTGAAGRIVWWPPHSSPSTELGHERPGNSQGRESAEERWRRRRQGMRVAADGSRSPPRWAPGGRQRQQGARRAPKAAAGVPKAAARPMAAAGTRRAPNAAGRPAGAKVGAEGSRAARRAPKAVWAPDGRPNGSRAARWGAKRHAECQSGGRKGSGEPEGAEGSSRIARRASSGQTTTRGNRQSLQACGAGWSHAGLKGETPRSLSGGGLTGPIRGCLGCGACCATVLGGAAECCRACGACRCVRCCCAAVLPVCRLAKAVGLPGLHRADPGSPCSSAWESPRLTNEAEGPFVSTCPYLAAGTENGAAVDDDDDLDCSMPELASDNQASPTLGCEGRQTGRRQLLSNDRRLLLRSAAAGRGPGACRCTAQAIEPVQQAPIAVSSRDCRLSDKQLTGSGRSTAREDTPTIREEVPDAGSAKSPDLRTLAAAVPTSKRGRTVSEPLDPPDTLPASATLNTAAKASEQGPGLAAKSRESRARNQNCSASAVLAPAVRPVARALNLVFQNLKNDVWRDMPVARIPEETAIRHRYTTRTSGSGFTTRSGLKSKPNALQQGRMRECFRLKKLSGFSKLFESWHSRPANYVAKKYIETVDPSVCTSLSSRNREGAPLYHLEHHIEGEYIKHNSNSGFIHTAEGKEYGDGNLGVRGMALFFSSTRVQRYLPPPAAVRFDLAPSECVESPSPSDVFAVGSPMSPPSILDSAAAPRTTTAGDRHRRVRQQAARRTVWQPLQETANHAPGDEMT